MKLSVVITSFDRREALSRCLASLDVQDAPPGSFEVVVVLDGCTDGSREMLAASRLRAAMRVVEQPNLGTASVRNAGARVAGGGVLLFLDDDLVCDAGLVTAHLAAHATGKSSIVFGRMQASPAAGKAGTAENDFAESLARYYARLEADPTPRWPDDAWLGPNCSIRREAFLASSGFDSERFPRRLEDVELGLRLWKAGLPFRYERRAVTRHVWDKSPDRVLRDAQRDGAAMVDLCRKHPDYRPHSAMAMLAAAPAWKRWAWRVAAGFPLAFGAGLHALAAMAAALPPGKASCFDRWRHSAWLVAGARRRAGSWDALLAPFRSRVAVLLYHHVGTPNRHTARESLTVTPTAFRRHLRWLRRRGYSPITAADWLAWRDEAKPLPRKPVMLTFDDGYADLAEHAIPELRRQGFAATLFVITGKPGGLDTWEGLPMLSADDVRLCASAGLEIGGHSRTHPDLRPLSEAQVDAEVEGSRRDLEALGLHPLAFAYPYGDHDERTRARVARSFRLAFTCDEGLNDLRTDPLLLRRTMVQPGDTLLDIELRAALGWSPFNTLRAALRLRSRGRRLAMELMHRLGIRRQRA